jgi:hypothetical protein
MHDARPENKRQRAANRTRRFQQYLGGYRNASGSDAPIEAVAAITGPQMDQVADAYLSEPDTERPLARENSGSQTSSPRPRTTLGPGGGRNARGQRRNRPSQSDIGRRLDISA